MNKTPLILLTTCLITIGAALVFAETTHEEHHDEAPAKTAKACCPAEKESESDPHDEHGEESDLDRPLDELFAASCEHGVLTHQCQECRYEIGVARVPQKLLDDGLIKMAPVQHRAGGSSLELTGEVAFDERSVARLSPVTSGVVVRRYVDLGDDVKAGQALVALRSTELALAEGEYLEASSQGKLAEKTFDRQKNLRKSGINSERELFESEQALDSAKVRRETLWQRLITLGLTEREIQDLNTQGMKAATGEVILRSGMSGRVLELQAVPGELVDASEQVALVADPARLWVWANLYDRDLPEMIALQRVGEPEVQVTVGAFLEKPFPAKLDFVGAAMNEQSRTVKVRVSLSNPEGLLRPGMFASVRLAAPNQVEALAVPSASVLSDEGRFFVFLRHQHEYFVRRQVVPGEEHENLTEIKLGLEEGQMVVSEGAFLLKSDVLRSKMGAGCAD